MQLEPNKKYQVELTGEEIGLIQAALVELPYKFTAQLIQDLPNKIKVENNVEVLDTKP
jgi:hypothetical protein